MNVKIIDKIPDDTNYELITCNGDKIIKLISKTIIFNYAIPTFFEREAKNTITLKLIIKTMADLLNSN